MSRFIARFLEMFQCETCRNYHVEPINFTIVTPLSAMTKTTLRDFPVFKNDYNANDKGKPRKMTKICIALLDHLFSNSFA